MKPQLYPHLEPNKGEATSGRLYQNPMLERLSRTSIRIPVILYLVISTVFLTYAFFFIPISLFSGMLLFMAGVVTWTFLEYVIHRYLYHCQTRMKWLKNLQHHAHHIHHQYPKDYSRLAMPPLPALVMLSMIFGLFFLLMGAYAVLVFAGFVIGYLCYIILHYSFHRYRAPRFRLLKKLWTWHALHHYKYPHTHAFGVSTPLWDYVFNTAP